MCALQQSWEPNAHICAASAAMASGRRDIAFEELDTAVKAAPKNVVALVARATWMSATRGRLCERARTHTCVFICARVSQRVPRLWMLLAASNDTYISDCFVQIQRRHVPLCNCSETAVCIRGHLPLLHWLECWSRGKADTQPH